MGAEASAWTTNGRGTIVSRAELMTEGMFLAGSRALASLSDPSDTAMGLLPGIERLREVSATIAVEVVKTAMAQGIAGVEVSDPIEAVQEAMWAPEYARIVI